MIHDIKLICPLNEEEGKDLEISTTSTEVGIAAFLKDALCYRYSKKSVSRYFASRCYNDLKIKKNVLH
jgi:predicted PolB exonuclease-like 3'-5' exonuclease